VHEEVEEKKEKAKKKKGTRQKKISTRESIK
jgi:hypothetical protein